MKQLFLILGQTLNLSEADLSLDTTADVLETWDSLAMINLAVAIEGEFEISLTAEEVEALVSVRSIVEILERHGVALAS